MAGKAACFPDCVLPGDVCLFEHAAPALAEGTGGDDSAVVVAHKAIRKLFIGMDESFKRPECEIHHRAVHREGGNRCGPEATASAAGSDAITSEHYTEAAEAICTKLAGEGLEVTSFSTRNGTQQGGTSSDLLSAAAMVARDVELDVL